MPYVRIEVLAGVDRAQKRALVADVTQSLVRNLGKKPEHVHVVIEEVEHSNWGYAGKLTDEWHAETQEAANADSTQ